MLAAVPIIGTEVNGAKRWIDLGFTNVQPSEIAKIALIIFYAYWLTNNKDKLNKLSTGFIIPFLYHGLTSSFHSAVFILLENIEPSLNCFYFSEGETYL